MLICSIHFVMALHTGGAVSLPAALCDSILISHRADPCPKEEGVGGLEQPW